MTGEERRKVCGLKLHYTSSTAVRVCRNASIVSPLLPKRGLGGTGKVLASFSVFVVLSNEAFKKNHEPYLWGVFDISQQCDVMKNLNLRSKNYSKI